MKEKDYRRQEVEPQTTKAGMENENRNKKGARPRFLDGATELELRVLEGNAEDAHGVGAAAARLPALEGDDGVALADDAELERLLHREPDTVVDVGLPTLVRVRSLRGGETSTR